MIKIVVTNVVASRSPERRPTATPTARAKMITQGFTYLGTLSAILDKLVRCCRRCGVAGGECPRTCVAVQNIWPNWKLREKNLISKNCLVRRMFGSMKFELKIFMR